MCVCVCVCVCGVIDAPRYLHVPNCTRLCRCAPGQKNAAFLWYLCVSLVGFLSEGLGVAAHPSTAVSCRYWGTATQAVTCQPSLGFSRFCGSRPSCFGRGGLTGFARV